MPAVTTKPVRGTTRGKKMPAARRKPAQSLYERFKHLIGTIDGPGDLSARSKTMEGYGQFRRP